MSIIAIILLVLAGLVVLLLISASFMRKNHYVKRDVIINAPSQKVFDYVKLLRNQDNFNKHAMTDTDRNKQFKGTDGTVGYLYSWSGDKSAGEGEKEIMKMVDGQRVEMEIRFVKPFKATAYIIMETIAMADNKTHVTWSNAGTLKYPINIMIPMMEKSVAKDMDSSLQTLKNILEN